MRRVAGPALLLALSLLLIAFTIGTSMSYSVICPDYPDAPGRCFDAGTYFDWNAGLFAGVLVGLVLAAATVLLWARRTRPALVTAALGLAAAGPVVLARLGDL